MAELAGSREISGPPYPPQHLGLGGSPSIIPDVPISSVFLGLFTFAAIAHMGLFQVNLHKRKRKFAFNAATFGFCCTRIIATSLRIAWACYPRNVAVGLSAQIFVYAGIPLLFFCNLFWAQRIVRAQHPHFGWSKPFSIWLPILMVFAVLTIMALISAIVVQFYLPDAYTQKWTRCVQLYGATFFGITAILPIPIELISTLAKTYPTLKDLPTDNFGSGNLTSKILISIFSSLLLSLGAWYRAITSYLDPLPITAPSPWYFSRPAFYTFNFTIEILVVLAWLAIRIDKRFIVPDGAKGPSSYANGFIFAGEPGNEKQGMSTRHLNASESTTTSNRSSSATLPPPSIFRADSWGSLQKFMSPDVTPAPSTKHVSWGGVSTSRVDSAFGEDGEEMQYEGVEMPASVAGAEHKMGFDPRSGKWDIRSLSVYSDRADLRPGSSLVTSEQEDKVELRENEKSGDKEKEKICESCGRCATCGAKS